MQSKSSSLKVWPELGSWQWSRSQCAVIICYIFFLQVNKIQLRVGRIILSQLVRSNDRIILPFSWILRSSHGGHFSKFSTFQDQHRSTYIPKIRTRSLSACISRSNGWIPIIFFRLYAQVKGSQTRARPCESNQWIPRYLHLSTLKSSYLNFKRIYLRT